MSWTDRYIGIPKVNLGRDWQGCDCYGLVRLVYAEDLRIPLPTYLGAYADADESAEVHQLLGEARTSGSWVRAERPQAFDIVCFRRASMDRHLGVVVDRTLMLHMPEGHSRIEPWSEGRWSHSLEGVYRHIEMASRGIE
ncbi:NlpC/P60 family protein [Ensifer soli]|uniref:NlpC/P60 family protein n=1 Tax=Ciceribacter sp. sgz301302 TaxID=3342379 RepID=UPI0035B9BA59